MMKYALIGALYAFAAAVQPGPFQAYLISQALTHGWRKTLLAACAPLLSDGPIIALTLFVLSTVPGWLVQFLRCAGGLFLLYLAFGAYRNWRDYDTITEAPVTSPERSMIKAAMINLLNPNPYLGWSLVTGPLLLQGWRESPANGIGLMVAFYATLIAGSMCIVLIFARARSFGARVNKYMIGFSVVALAAFGAYQLWSGVVS